MVTWDTTITEWKNLILSLGFCSGMEQIGLAMLDQWEEKVKKDNKDKKEPTILDCFKVFEKENIDMDYFILWLGCNVGNEFEFSPEIREACVKAIKNPRTALKLYYKSPHLTDREDELLKEKFIVDGKHLFPQVEKEIKDGTIVRAKVWTDALNLKDLSKLGTFIRSTSAAPAINLEENEIDI